jgi:hypothetical protein
VNEFLAIEFARVEVRPSAYAIRTGPRIRGGPQLNGFVFQGIDSSGNTVTLDERNYPYDTGSHYASRVFYIDTGDYFSHFRLTVARGGAFALSAFEIHGGIRLKETVSTEVEGSEAFEGSEEEVFDPWDLPDFE